MSDERKPPPGPYVDPVLAAGRPPEAREADPRPKASRSARPAADPGTPRGAPGAGGLLCGPLGSADPSAAGAVTGELVEPPTLKSQADFYRQRRRQERQAKQMARIAKVDNEIRREASKILLDAFAAAELQTVDVPGPFGMVETVPVKPEGWSERKFRTARDARKSHREAPTYIQHAARMVESFRRSEALEKEGAPAPTLNCEIQVQVNNQYNYEVIEQKGD